MEKKSNHLVGSIICGLLTAFGIVTSIVSLVGRNVHIINDVFLLVLSVLIGCYAFAAYKKPHGNLLKYIILLYAVNLIFSLKVTVQVGNINLAILTGIKIGVLCYIAGRLAKAKENLILMIVFLLIDIGVCIWHAVSGMASIGIFAFLVIGIDICAAYFLRYKEHKEAGLADAPKAK